MLVRLGCAGLLAALLSQFPAFSDQYVQRLGGQVDALRQVAGAFDASAARAGLSRAAALDDLSASAFQTAHQANLRTTFARLDRAEADLARLRAASPLARMALPQRLRDPATLRATWADFRPALPMTRTGLTAALIGFGLGWVVSGLAGVVLTRRRQRRIAG